MDIKTSNKFKETIKKAALNLIKSKKNRVYLDKPFGGFWISFNLPEDNKKIFKVYSTSELNIETVEKKIYVVCESLLGKKTKITNY